MINLVTVGDSILSSILSEIGRKVMIEGAVKRSEYFFSPVQTIETLQGE